MNGFNLCQHCGNRKLHFASTLVVALVASCTPNFVNAQSTWTGLGGTNNWGNAGNWDTPVPPLIGSSVTLVGPANNVINLGADRFVGTLTFNSTIRFSLLNKNLAINSGVTTTNSISGEHEILSNVTIVGPTVWNIHKDAPLDVAGVISNVGSMVKQGSGVLTLAGLNTYSGDTTVDGGVLSIANDFLSDSADVILDATATLDLTHVGTDTIDELVLGGFSRAVGTHGAIGSGADFEWRQITGTGLLLVSSFTGQAGDYNGDSVVNIADYTVWRDNLGAPAGTLVNDPNTGTIGMAQYDTWQSNFRAYVAASAAIEANTIPEPSAIALVAVAGLLLVRPRLVAPKALDGLP